MPSHSQSASSSPSTSPAQTFPFANYNQSENAWTLTDEKDGTAIETWDGNNAQGEILYIFDWTLSTCASYTFTITDKYGDGLTSNISGKGPSYLRITVVGESEPLKGTSDGTSFGAKDSVLFYVCE